jgi:histidyl-tRNA synthetase
MKVADRSGARFAVLIGSDESAAGEVTLRDLTSGDQERIPRDGLVAALRSRIDTPSPEATLS